MSDQIVDAGFEALLRETLKAEAARLPVRVTPEQVLERRRLGGTDALPRIGSLGLGGSPTLARWRAMWAVAAAAAVIVVAGSLGVAFVANQPVATPSPSTSAAPSPSADTRTPAPSAPPATAAPVDPAVAALVGQFLDARIAGSGAEQFLVGDQDPPVPLLYATSAGAKYERAEFQPVTGYAWGDDIAFKVRLYAGDTVVEQLIFYVLQGRGLGYSSVGRWTDIAPTTENGRPLAVASDWLDGAVTLRIAHPWVGYRLVPQGSPIQPTTDGGERREWDLMWLLADLVIDGCPTGARAANAGALAEQIRSTAGLTASAPVRAIIGGAEALVVDVAVAAGTPYCESGLGVLEWYSDGRLEGSSTGFMTGHTIPGRLRVYLIDAPAGSSMRTLAIAILATEATFQRATETAAEAITSIEFNVP